MAGGLEWNVAAVITIVGWLVLPIIGLLLPKILSRLEFEFDLDKKIQEELESRIIPELRKTLHAVDTERMMKRREKPKSDVDNLDKMAARLRHAWYEAEDILDDAQHKIVVGDILYHAGCTCIVRCLGFARVVQKGSARLLTLVRQFLGRRDVEMLKADLKKISSKMCGLLLNGGHGFGQLSRVGRLRMVPKTLRADMLKTILELRWLRPEDAGAQGFYAIDDMLSAPLLLGPRPAQDEEEDIHDDLDKMVVWLRRAEVEDNLDHLPHCLYVAVQTCTARCMGIAESGSSRLLQWAQNISFSRCFLRRSLDDELPTNRVDTAAASHSSGWWLFCWCTSLGLFKSCCISLFHWLLHVYEVARTHRDQSYGIKSCCISLFHWLLHVYEVARTHRDQSYGITSYQEYADIDFLLTTISRQNLKKRIHKVEIPVTQVKNSPLLSSEIKSILNDTANKNKSEIMLNGIANKNRSEIGTASKRKVFGRELLREHIMKRLHETPQGDALCYSVIGMYGLAGSGKTTFAGYLRDHIKAECKEKLFDAIMCIHVSKTFSVGDIFHEMLGDITNDRHSNISDRKKLEQKLKESLYNKRFFLVLDDLWVENKNDRQLQELISPLNVGMKGSKILVTARTKDAAEALRADELIEMPDLDEEQYFEMFMHYALGGKSVDVKKKFEQVGREIAKKLLRSPIAAATVAGRLGEKQDMNIWKNIANHEKFNEITDILWWSYQELNPDIRRCLEFCNIFPSGLALNREMLVDLWIAQGFIKTSRETKGMEYDIADGYVQELVSCSFLQPERTGFDTDCFTIHDLVHDLLDKVVGSDYFRIKNDWSQKGYCWKGDIPQDVRLLFVHSYDGKLITEKILRLKKIRTLIFFYAETSQVEEKAIENICRRLPKLRVLKVAIQAHGNEEPKKFSIPESIGHLKHLRYLVLRRFSSCIILPSTLAKLQHIERLDFGSGKIWKFNFPGLTNLRHIICMGMQIPNIGRLSSLQTIEVFKVRNEEGYEVKQLRDLNKLRGSLEIYGLENVKSKDEAVEANLAAKKRLTELQLGWYEEYGHGDDTKCSPEVEAEVLEGLCPPVGLKKLVINDYKGSRYPEWMVVEQRDGPNEMQEVQFHNCSQLGPGPELGAFPRLRELYISYCCWGTLPCNMEQLTLLEILEIEGCINIQLLPTLPKSLRVLKLEYCSWDALPGNMEHLTSLKELKICGCKNILSLPTLPRSLLKFELSYCDDDLMKGCQKVGDPNWFNIKDIPKKTFEPTLSSSTSSEDVASHASEEFQA